MCFSKIISTKNLQTNVFLVILVVEKVVKRKNKSELFKDELNYLKNEDIKKSATELINILPEYFFHEAASSTGKYHPKYALGEGGLLRHTKAACYIAHELLNDPAIGEKYTSREKDLMIVGLIMHDGLKRGLKEETYTRFDHPLLAANFVYENREKADISEEEALFLKEVISSHMGPWTKDYNGNEVLPYPKTKYQNFVHMCDYLASRKGLLVPFDSANNVSLI